MAFMPEHAPLVILMFLGAASLTGFAAIIALTSAFLKRKWLALGATGILLAIGST